MSKKKKFNRSPILTEIEDVIVDTKIDLPKVGINVFVLNSGMKKDQLGGFICYAKMNSLMFLTIPQWKEEYNNYKTKPVRS